MKLNKTTVIILLIGILAIAFIGLGATRSKQVTEQNKLNADLVQAQLKLNGLKTDQLTERKAELDKELNQTMSQSATDRTLLSQQVVSLDVNRVLFSIAETTGCQVLEIACPGTSSTNLNGVKCETMQVTASIAGDLPALVSFVTALNAELQTAPVQVVEVDIPEPPVITESEEPAGEPEEQEPIPETTSVEKTTAVIQFSVYTYQGN